MVRDAVSHSRHVEWLGIRSNEEVLEAIGDAAFVVFPSECYEACPRVLIECLAKGTPVLAAKIGAAAELISADRTGLHFRAGDPDHLALQAERLVADSARLAGFRRQARQEFERKFTAKSSYDQLMSIYENVRVGRR
jgi:glycosyltransferase involved in cell wall biosynthesis